MFEDEENIWKKIKFENSFMYESVTQNFYTSKSKKIGGIETCNFYMQLLLLFILWYIPWRERLEGICLYTLKTALV